MLQKKYKDAGVQKAKMKKTPTLAELKVSKHKKKMLDPTKHTASPERTMVHPSGTLVPNRDRAIPLHRSTLQVIPAPYQYYILLHIAAVKFFILV